MKSKIVIACLGLGVSAWLASCASGTAETDDGVVENTGKPFAIKKSDNPVEVGQVNWGRNLDAALVEARNSGKPIFALFQEVPG